MPGNQEDRFIMKRGFCIQSIMSIHIKSSLRWKKKKKRNKQFPVYKEFHAILSLQFTTQSYEVQQ